MSKTFWRKNQKLIVDKNNKLIYCEKCPCGYYSIFGIKYRYLNSQTMQPIDNYSWEYEIQPFEIKNNKIIWNSFSEIQLPITKTIGECCYKKVRQDCWQDCEQWDEETQQCIKYKEYCDTCIEIYVYNLAGFFSNYQKFEKNFWKPCGYQSDYPDIWYTYYGQKYLTDEAQNCLSNYWQKQFTDKYMLNFKLTLYNLCQRWWEYIAVWITHEQPDFCYCYNLDTEDQYQLDDPSKDCQQGYEKYCEESQVIDGIGSYCWMESETDAFQQLHPLKLFADYQEGHECCAMAEAAGLVGQINAHIMQVASVKQNFIADNQSSTKTWEYSCNNSDALCVKFDYKSHATDNFGLDNHNLRLVFSWRKFDLKRNENTPDSANGIKFKKVMIRTFKDQGDQPWTRTETSESIINVAFGSTYDGLPVASETNCMTVISTDSCNEECEYTEQSSFDSYPKPVAPGGYGVMLTDQIEIQLIALEYI